MRDRKNIFNVNGQNEDTELPFIINKSLRRNYFATRNKTLILFRTMETNTKPSTKLLKYIETNETKQTIHSVT